MESEIPYYIGFSVFPGIGPIRFKLLLSYFGSAQNAYQASLSDLKAVGLGERLTQEFLKFRQAFVYKEYAKKLAAKKIRVLTLNDQKYPSLLKSISDPPIALFIFGSSNLDLLNHLKLVAIVGTRMVTTYGREVTSRFAVDLASSGCVVVSGMAYGVDAIAHKAALDAAGQTIAVLGCGVDVIAPASNTALYREISENNKGLIISEMPLGHMPNKGLFPARNRIISGLCKGVVVTEGAVDSGSLITARYAAEQGREVCAVPGSVSSIYSQGPAKLIKNGASLVESAADVCEVLGFKKTNTAKSKPSGLSPIMDQIYDLLAKTPLDGNSIAQALNEQPNTIFSVLTKLELEDVIVKNGEFYNLA